MIGKLSSLALLAVMLILPLHAATVVAEPFPPARFTSLYLERDDKGTSTVIQASGDTVSYKVTAGNKVTDSATVTPSPDDWFKFIQALNSAKVYKWAPKYEYPGQGETWVIDLAMDDRNFGSQGTNEYPKDGAEDQPNASPGSGPSVAFQIFWHASLGLVGKDTPAAAEK
jgi:hypothetical protein